MLIRAVILFFIFIGFANAELLVEKKPNTDISYFVGKGEDSKVAEKINAILRRGPPPGITSTPPETGDNETSNSYYSIEAIRNDAKVVSVLIRSEGCAASCSSNNDHYNFDARTGEYIHVSSLFTQAGMAQISSRLIKSWTQQIRKDAQTDAPSDSWVDECVERMKTNYGKGTPYMGYDFVLGPKGATFVGAYCTKTMSSYPASMSYQEMFSYLSEYGKNLFSKNATINQPMHPFNQIFTGTIGGKYPIKMFLFEPYPSAGYLEGYYLYTKHNKPINIVGFYENNTLIIQEKDEKDQNTGAKITAHPSKNGFDGYWEGNNKKLKFSVIVGYP